MPQTIEVLLLAVLLLPCIAGWLWVLARYRQSPTKPLVEPMPRRRPFWRASDFLVFLGLQLMLMLVAQQYFVAQGWITFVETDTLADSQLTSTSTRKVIDGIWSMMGMRVAASIAGLGAVVLTLAWLRRRAPDWIGDLGLRFRIEDIRMGLFASILIIPPVLLINLAASYVAPYHHPVLDDLKDSPSLSLFATMLVTTAFVGPFLEEFGFRLLLQGGLQSMADRDDEQGRWIPRSDWPLIVTSLIFAMLHYGQGAAYIPLFFFSLAIGYLYRQTGRFLVPLTVHMVLNTMTLCVTFLDLLYGAS